MHGGLQEARGPARILDCTCVAQASRSFSWGSPPCSTWCGTPGTWAQATSCCQDHRQRGLPWEGVLGVSPTQTSAFLLPVGCLVLPGAWTPNNQISILLGVSIHPGVVLAADLLEKTWLQSSWLLLFWKFLSFFK